MIFSEYVWVSVVKYIVIVNKSLNKISGGTTKHVIKKYKYMANFQLYNLYVDRKKGISCQKHNLPYQDQNKISF